MQLWAAPLGTFSTPSTIRDTVETGNAPPLLVISPAANSSSDIRRRDAAAYEAGAPAAWPRRTEHRKAFARASSACSCLAQEVAEIFAIYHQLWRRGPMTITKKDMHAALTAIKESFCGTPRRPEHPEYKQSAQRLPSARASGTRIINATIAKTITMTTTFGSLKLSPATTTAAPMLR